MGGWHNTRVAAGQTIFTGGPRNVVAEASQTYKTTGDFSSEASANHAFKSTNAYFKIAGDFQTVSTTAGFNQGESFYVHAGTSITLQAGCAQISMKSGKIDIDNGAGCSISLIGGLLAIHAGAGMMTTVGGPMMTTVGGPKTNVVAGPVSVVATGDINAAAPKIKLNG